jgi:hypothetical protein
MNTFVQGVLVVQEEPYRNELNLGLTNGETLFLFYQQPREARKKGEDDQLDALLESGKFYELLIIVRVRHVTYTPTISPETSSEPVRKELQESTSKHKHKVLLQGKVIDLSLDANKLHYQAIATPRIYEQQYLLLETEIGNVVVSHTELQENLPISIEDIAVGSYLEWAPSRLDVLAIIEKQDTIPSRIS